MRSSSVLRFLTGARGDWPSAVVSLSLLASCAGHSMPAPPSGTRSSHAGESASAPKGDAVARGTAAYDASRYAEAEKEFRQAAAQGSIPARLGLARVLLMTGRAALAEQTASDLVGATPELSLELSTLHAEALHRQGKVTEAQALLESITGDPAARRARLLLGEVLIEQGKRREAEPVLMTLIDEYNQGDLKDAARLAMVGRAASLLGSPTDANDAFEESERAGPADAETLLYRAEVFLEAYDPGHAEECVTAVLAKAPHHPDALAAMAEVKLASNLDFDAAEKLARQALAVHPGLDAAEGVLAGAALRDMDLAGADRHVNAGLVENPRNLSLLSLRAAIRFLADDAPGFERAKADVLAKNPRYSRLYQIIGEYAEWEHRYEDIVEMMREALFADPNDAKVRAQLGFNLIRAGEDAAGVSALQRAFQDDPFNVRVFNTLKLYEKDIPKKYVTLGHGKFVVRYSREEEKILDRIVPPLLETAWSELTKKYGFVPKTPVGVELYPSREDFAIRTSGLPQTFIQGVCFGRTLAAMSPNVEHFNLGMTLWHELSHVFHIQLSKNHVPRWFTEGLAEHETLVARPEWRREFDAELQVALASGRLPKIQDLNRTFTHAEDMDDMATAYYASTQVVGYIVQHYGMKKVTDMLVAWGAGKRTDEVIRSVLDIGADALDEAFRAELRARLAPYANQFVPPSRSTDVATAEARLRESPKDPERHALLALAHLSVGDETKARAALDQALALDPKQGTALWLRVQLAKTGGNREGARQALDELVQAGHDGYAVQMTLADVAATPAERRKALEAAHRFDPKKADPVRGLVELARAERDEGAELGLLRDLAAIEENDGDAYRRLLGLLIARNETEEALRVGAAGVFVDAESAEMHRLYAEALGKSGDRADAERELETAVLGHGTATELARAHGALSAVLAARGDKRGAAEHARAAQSAAEQARTGPI
ncbi:MAG TPA: tetratricopeptide repeat protein [Polyangiaceae bacterium]|nr:tetratricopeptide repeat protein [Polyangiaceae bacterium]